VPLRAGRSRSDCRELVVLLCCLASTAPAPAAQWVRAGITTNQPVWGISGGLQFAIHPAGFKHGEPRGLIRLGYPLLPGGGYDLVNFIAVEPIVRGKRGFSELEQSGLDDVRGKRFRAGPEGDPSAAALDPGKLSTPTPGVEQLDVIIRVEEFANGADVFLVVSQRSDEPEEIALTIHGGPDSAPMDYCVLTATMGNMIRARQLWLRDEIIDSHKLYPNHKGTGFTQHTSYPTQRLHRMADGSILVPLTTDETDAGSATDSGRRGFWDYRGQKVTQYWKKPAGAFRDDLRAVVNARYTYYGTTNPIPGGVAFENFELQERYYEGQRFVFGITRKTPRELGVNGR
jgi:hypothetical protein